MLLKRGLLNENMLFHVDTESKKADPQSNTND